METDKKIENPDHYVYSWVMFYPDTVDFFISSLKFYKEILSNETSLIDKDKYLSSFLTIDTRRDFNLDGPLLEVERLIEWLEKEVQKNSSHHSIDITLSHKTVRLLKSIGFLYLQFLKQRRNAISAEPNVTSKLMSAIDRQITTKEEELNNLGVFKDASLIPLLADQVSSQTNKTTEEASITDSITKTKRPRPQIIQTIEILDAELRARCLDLFNQFEESGQSDRHDTVVAEATRILENRLRDLTKSTDGAPAAKLVSRAFDKQNAILKVSEINSEQEAAELLFRGVFGFIRNQFQHKLISDITPERVLQILGLIDYLISIINSVEPKKQIVE